MNVSCGLRITNIDVYYYFSEIHGQGCHVTFRSS